MNTLETMFDWLLATTLRASVLAGVILGIQLLLRRWLPPQWRYALWLPLLLILTLPVLPSVPFGILPGKAPAAAVTATRAPASSEIGTAAPLLPAPAGAARPASSPGVNPWALAWLAGSAAVLALGIVSYRRNMRRIVKHVVTTDEALLRSIDKAAGEVGLRRMPRVIVSTEVESPAVTGLVLPSLLLPAGFPAGFSDEEAKLILLHELTHLKRLDLPVNGLCCVLQAMHWFNPILWFAFARMRADRESACDAQVLSLNGKDCRSAYGHALLKLQSPGFFPGLRLGFVGISERGAGMKSRIRDISSHRAAHPAWRAGGVGMIGILVLFGATKAQEQQAVEPGAAAGPEVPADGKDKPASSGQIYLNRKLDAIILPEVKFENAPLPEVIDFLRNRSVEMDTNEPNRTRKGVNFVIRMPRSGQPAPGAPASPQAMTLSLNLEKVSLRQAFDAICKETGLVYKVDDFAVTFLPAGEKDDPPAPPAPPAPQMSESAIKAMNAAREIVIPTVDFEDVSLTEAVKFLNLQAKELSNGVPLLPIGLDPKVDGETRIKELRLRKVPLFEALKYCAEATRTTLVVDDTGFRFKRP